MTELPKELIESLEKKAADLKHRWMYSFMMRDEMVFLVGYCPSCNNSVSSFVRTLPNETVITYAGIPKWGCIPEQEID